MRQISFGRALCVVVVRITDWPLCRLVDGSDEPTEGRQRARQAKGAAKGFLGASHRHPPPTTFGHHHPQPMVTTQYHRKPGTTIHQHRPPWLITTIHRSAPPTTAHYHSPPSITTIGVYHRSNINQLAHLCLPPHCRYLHPLPRIIPHRHLPPPTNIHYHPPSPITATHHYSPALPPSPLTTGSVDVIVVMALVTLFFFVMFQ